MIGGVMEKALSELVQYISQQLEQGIPEHTIRDSLKTHGWTPEWIERGFQETKKYAETTRPTLPTPLSPPTSGKKYSRNGSKPVRVQVPWKLVAILVSSAILIALAIIVIPIILTSLAKPGLERAQRDIERKHSLNIVLTDMADYFVANKEYPTLTEVSAADFAGKNPDFDTKAIVDPEWSIAQKACTKDKKAIFAERPAVGCFAYLPTTSDGLPCNNDDKPCTRMKITIMLEQDNKSYSVTLDRNSQK